MTSPSHMALLSQVLDDLGLCEPPVQLKVRSDARLLRQAAEDLGRDPDASLDAFLRVLGERRRGSAVTLPTLLARLVPEDPELLAAAERRDVARIGQRRRNHERKVRHAAAHA